MVKLPAETWCHIVREVKLSCDVDIRPNKMKWVELRSICPTWLSYIDGDSSLWNNLEAQGDEFWIMALEILAKDAVLKRVQIRVEDKIDESLSWWMLTDVHDRIEELDIYSESRRATCRTLALGFTNLARLRVMERGRLRREIIIGDGEEDFWKGVQTRLTSLELTRSVVDLRQLENMLALRCLRLVWSEPIEGNRGRRFYRSVSSTKLLMVLGTLGALETLELSVTFSEMRTGEEEVVELGSLKRLGISMTGRDGRVVFGGLRLPCLEDIDIEIVEDDQRITVHEDAEALMGMVGRFVGHWGAGIGAVKLGDYWVGGAAKVAVNYELTTSSGEPRRVIARWIKGKRPLVDVICMMMERMKVRSVGRVELNSDVENWGEGKSHWRRFLHATKDAESVVAWASLSSETIGSPLLDVIGDREGVWSDSGDEHHGEGVEGLVWWPRIREVVIEGMHTISDTKGWWNWLSSRKEAGKPVERLVMKGTGKQEMVPWKEYLRGTVEVMEWNVDIDQY